MALLFACFSALLATGAIPSTSASAPNPPDPGNLWAAAAFFLVMAVGFVLSAVRVARRQLREHPPPAQQPSEAG